MIEIRAMEMRSPATPAVNGPSSERQGALADLGELGRPVFFDGEDERKYFQLHARVIEAVKPNDVIEEFWVRDVVDLMWETLRLRRLKANLIITSMTKGLKKVLLPCFESYTDLCDMVNGWYNGVEGAAENVQELLTRTGLTMEHVRAETLSAKLDDIERIDRMLATTEARRHVVLREMDRHRAAVASRLRLAVEAIEDAEYSDVAADGRMEAANAP